jgi:hypothetical protein
VPSWWSSSCSWPGGLYLNYQRDQREKAVAAREAAVAAAEAQLPVDIAGCGRGVGRWGGKVSELRDPSGTLLSRNIHLDYDSYPQLGESEAVLVAWLACDAKVSGLGLPPSYTIYESEGRRVYSLGGEHTYHVVKGRIVAITLGGSTKVLPPE